MAFTFAYRRRWHCCIPASSWGWPSLPGAAERLAELDTVVREWGALVVYRRSGRIAPEVWREADPGAP